jgi:UTP-glucose-1-phosphate uridylyltransferase
MKVQLKAMFEVEFITEIEVPDENEVQFVDAMEELIDHNDGTEYRVNGQLCFSGEHRFMKEFLKDAKPVIMKFNGVSAEYDFPPNSPIQAAQ